MYENTFPSKFVIKPRQPFDVRRMKPEHEKGENPKLNPPFVKGGNISEQFPEQSNREVSPRPALFRSSTTGFAFPLCKRKSKGMMGMVGGGLVHCVNNVAGKA